MISNRYQITDILKQSKTKSIYRVQDVSQSPKMGKNLYYVIKQYGLSQQKYFNKQLMMYNIVLKDMFLRGFPELKNLGQEKQYSYIVLSQLGQNLEELRKRAGGRFTLKTVLMVGLQILERIQDLHNKGYIHGDIQPTNFLIGSGKFSHKLYLVDYDFSSPYMAEGKHIKEQVIDNFTGSIKFCSLAANTFKNISRKDDLQSFIYSLIYLIKGTLPWSDLKSNTFLQVYNQTAKIKKQNLKLLLEGLPQIFQSVIQYIRGLKFEQKPNYEKIKKLFSALMKKNGYDLDYKYDWTYI